MSNITVRFERISKRYRLRQGWYGSIQDAARDWGRRLFRGSDDRGVFWALRDVSFEVERGDVVGLIGSNGAGKSTLLKILSRVTVPTSGTFFTRGRLGALIEIGAGFHPDLTGRENVYLNGALMGMRRREIDAKFDEIVAFADVPRFIDTPVKRYSSGMLVRLGFSVAAHTDPDVLLIDEVLAVGDAAFQTRCLNRLAEMKEQGKTIILVSHHMANILHHSRKVLWLQAGQVRGYGDPEATVEEYLQSVREVHAAGMTPLAGADGGDHPVRIETVALVDRQGQPRPKFQHGETVCIDIAFTMQRPVIDPVFEVTFQDSHGYPLGGLTSRLDGIKVDPRLEHGTMRLTLSPILFLKGDYTVNAHVRDHLIERYYDVKKKAVILSVDGPSIASREMSGHLMYPHEWEMLSGHESN
jgi:ABC-type polysaccharide/polyol phosphate transport system ATPase subunit